MTILHLGVDYGTSATKVVVRDEGAAGGGRSLPLSWDDVSDEWRLPSVVALHGGAAWFGLDPTALPRDDTPPRDAVWCGSLKMRVAAQLAQAPERVRAHAEVLTNVNLPADWSYEHLLVASLVWNLRVAKNKALTATGHRAADTKFTVTFGLPTDFRHNEKLSRHFLDIFRAAFDLAGNTLLCKYAFPDGSHRVELTDALRRLFDEALLRSKALDADHVNYWHQSEARASSLWAWNTAAFGAGAYLHVDIGAGTTNVAAYLVAARFDGKWTDDRISILGAESGTAGMDAVTAASPHITPVLRRDLQMPYRTVFGAVRRLTGGDGPAWVQWQQARLVALGGGAVHDNVVNVFAFHPFVPNLEMGVCELGDVPEDLELGLGQAYGRSRLAYGQRARRTLAIAYGLSCAYALPDERLAGGLPPFARRDPQGSANLAGIYER